jgi:hypothetical protein
VLWLYIKSGGDIEAPNGLPAYLVILVQGLLLAGPSVCDTSLTRYPEPISLRLPKLVAVIFFFAKLASS